MFELFNTKTFTKSIRLSEAEQNRLMGDISRAGNFRDVEDKFNKLYYSVAYPLWANLANKYIPPLTIEDMKDAFQESWIKIIEARDKYDGKSSAFKWIYVIKKNMVIDKIRSLKRKKEDSIDDNGDDESDTIAEVLRVKEESPLVDNRMISEETINIIMDAIESIEDDDTREMFKRRIVYGHKFEQISEDMDIPMTTVYKKINKALSFFRPKIQRLINS